MKVPLLLLSLILLQGCISAGSAAPKRGVLLKSSYPIISLDEKDIEPSYELELEAGHHTLMVVYSTYRKNYHCLFTWQAQADTRYEIVDSSNTYPLTLFRWARRNGLWAIRYDPLDPERCEKRAVE